MGKVPPWVTTGILVALCFGVALFFRVVLPFAKVFTDNWIKFSGGDAYSHMRLVDNLVRNFPHLMTFDPYRIYPGGGAAGSINPFDWLLAGIIRAIPFGSLTERIDVVSVYFPAVLGALTVIPVYFVGKELFNRRVGVLSAGLVAILPGEFLGRSILGFTDHHVAETLLTTIVMLFLLLAIKTASQRQLTFSHLKRQGWATSARPVLYSLLAGIFLGVYLHTWAGGLLFVFIILLYFVVQFIIDHLKGRPTDYLCVVSVPLFLVAAIIFLPVYQGMFYVVPMVIALLAPLALNGISRLMANKKLKSAYYPLTLLGLGLAGWGLFYLTGRPLLSAMLDALKFFVPTGAALTTIEMQPFFKPLVFGGNFFDTAAWANFNTTIFLSLVSFLCILLYFVFKQGSAEKNILIVWTLVILAATAGQRRFAYYFAVNVALLTGYMSVLTYYAVRFVIDRLWGSGTSYLTWRTLELPSFAEPGETRPVRASTRVERKRFQRLEKKKAKRLEREQARVVKQAEPRFGITAIHTSIGLWMGLIVFLLAFFPNPKAVANAEQAGLTGGAAWWRTSLIKMAVNTASQAQFVPSDGWLSSLSWMKENTPDPFGDPDFYYYLETDRKYRSLSELKRSVPNPSGDPDFYYQLEASYKYPESAYGVLAWWDYGYWITRMAHRIPNADPGQDPRAVVQVASFFTSQNENSANEIAQELGTAYVIVDLETATNKFWAVATWAGKGQSEFFDVYLVPEPEQNRYVARLLYYPDYYRALSTRLYNFDGRAVTPERTPVISYQEVADQKGNIYKLVTGQEEFDSYEEAVAYLSSQESANYRIASDNPFISPLPLVALEHYRLIHGSDSLVTLPDGKQVPAVKIFEYLD